jgi:hypothetical protein
LNLFSCASISHLATVLLFFFTRREVDYIRIRRKP